MFDLRYYQKEAVESAMGVWDRHQGAAIVSATGTGKTEVYLHLAVTFPGRILVIAHRDYLIGQPIKRLAEHGFKDVAIEKAERKSERDFRKAKIVFASIQSLSRPNRLATFNPSDFALVIVDEGHRAVSPTYRRAIDHFRQNPRVRVLILTATPKRKDGIALGNLCDGDIEVAYSYAPKRAAEEGWIVYPRFYRHDVKSLDFSNVNLKGADLDSEQTQKLLMEEKPLHEVCAALSEMTGPTIVFCPGVEVARAYTLLMNKRYRPGRSVALWESSPDDEREEAGKKLSGGDLDFIMNVDLYTEGYDIQELLRVVWATVTASLVKFTQGTGRVFRPHSCLRGQLVGGLAEAEARRMLIEQSPKPFAQVVTFYPQNCKHQVCEPNDILGGDELPPDVRTAAKLIQEVTAAQPGGSDPLEDVETATALVGLRKLLEERRKRLKAKADVTVTEYDAFGGSANRMAARPKSAAQETVKKITGDWPEGDAASPAQLGWMRYKGVRDVDQLGLTKFRAKVVRDLMDLGVSAETALGYGKRQALAVRASMQAKKSEAEKAG